MAPGIGCAAEFLAVFTRPTTDGQMSTRKPMSLFWIGCLLALCPVSAFSQSQTTGRISGTVKDPHGACIVGAEITVISLATTEKRKVKTNDRGNYAVPLLLPGMYRISVTANGFKKTDVESIRVAITETFPLDLNLEVGTMSEQVLVSTLGLLIRTEGPQMGRVVDSRAVAELPLATRNFLQILALSPGTVASLPDNTALGRNSQAISVNGARGTQNNFEINGIDANRLSTHDGGPLAVPAPETIQEFKVQTSLYDATSISA
ncbi:MAG: hypothetical protein DMF74_24545, partial [Acidobacteria bacterium]